MPKFCAKPFEDLSVHSDGTAWVCCHDWLSTPIGNLHESNLTDVWNSDTAKAIRRSILDGSFSYCNKDQCPVLVANRLPRVNVSQLEELAKFSKPTEELKAPLPKNLSLTYDSTCNLKCPSCRNDYIVFDKQQRTAAKQIHDAIFHSNLKDVRRLILTGYGDPFSSSIYREFLRTATREKFPKLKINLMTNGLLLTPRMWQHISSSHELIRAIHVSVDACSQETYLISRGGNFSALLDNLEFIATLKKGKLISSFEISFVVQQHNFHEMPEFVNLGLRLGCNKVLFQRIINWGTYSPDDFASRAIHDVSHPQHHEFTKLISSEIFKSEIVDMSNLNNLIT